MLKIDKLDNDNIRIRHNQIFDVNVAAIFFAEIGESGRVSILPKEAGSYRAFSDILENIEINGVSGSSFTPESAVKELNSFIGNFRKGASPGNNGEITLPISITDVEGLEDKLAAATGEASQWGNIEGDIRSQTDLQSKLDLKLDKGVSDNFARVIMNGSLADPSFIQIGSFDKISYNAPFIVLQNVLPSELNKPLTVQLINGGKLKYESKSWVPGIPQGPKILYLSSIDNSSYTTISYQVDLAIGSNPAVYMVKILNMPISIDSIRVTNIDDSQTFVQKNSWNFAYSGEGYLIGLDDFGKFIKKDSTLFSTSVRLVKYIDISQASTNVGTVSKENLTLVAEVDQSETPGRFMIKVNCINPNYTSNTQIQYWAYIPKFRQDPPGWGTYAAFPAYDARINDAYILWDTYLEDYDQDGLMGVGFFDGYLGFIDGAPPTTLYRVSVKYANGLLMMEIGEIIQI